MTIKINSEFKDRRVGHNNISKTVSEHTESELVLLGIQARMSKNPALLECFTDLPTLDELKNAKTAKELAATASVPETGKADKPAK